MNASAATGAVADRIRELLPPAVLWLPIAMAGCAGGETAGPPDPEIPPGPELIAISAGMEHTCAVTAENIAYCWGDNGGSQIGVNNVVQRVPRPARVLTDIRFSTVEAGPSHTCGLSTEGRGYCWGTSVWGRLDRPAPVEGAETLRSLSGRWTHNCGVDPSGAVLCWGIGSSGQLGTGDVGEDVARSDARPVDGLVAAQVAAGGSFTCALDEAGTVRCWGLHDAGQLGVGELESSPCTTPDDAGAYPCVASPVPVPLDVDVVEIAAGLSHACALDSEGRVHCWGDNELEQLGREEVEGRCDWVGNVEVDRPCSRTPLALEADVPPFTRIAAGAYHSCALTADGEAWCWGANSVGQLGIGPTSTHAPPIPVDGDLRFATLSGGELHTCGFTLDGTGYCWGYNASGQLGSRFEVAPVPERIRFDQGN